MKKILYLMHVPWGWVKQRPHWIAQILADSFEVDVYYRKLYGIGHQLAGELPPGLNVIELFVLPLERFELVWTMNCRLISSQLRNRINSYDLVWLTHPMMLDTIEQILPTGAKVVYDCMDNALEFPWVRNNARIWERVHESERKAMERSDFIFASSGSLRNVLVKRYGTGKEITVVPNAITMEMSESVRTVHPQIASALETDLFTLTYIGTISEWFDFDLILDSVERFQNIVVLLFGPTEVQIPAHERIVHLGPIQHKYIYDIMEQSDALIMPFKVNDLVLGVDPVKLYEYIYSGKPVMSVAYPETRKFADYAYLFDDGEGFLNLVSALVTSNLPPKMSLEKCRRFAEDNTWEKRVQLVIETICTRSNSAGYSA